MCFDYNLNSDAPNKAKVADDMPFIIIRPTFSTFNEGFRLREGDLMKLGKQAYKIKEMKLKEILTKDRTQCEKNDMNNDKGNEANYMNIPFQIINNQKNKKYNQCRICLGDDNESDNLLVRVCKCKGSMKYVHVMCIRNWYVFNYLLYIE